LHGDLFLRFFAETSAGTSKFAW